jgi:hypothetical protein
MKSLTLTQLRKAIDTIKTAKQFRGVDFTELMQAHCYMTGVNMPEPRDPRVVLTELRYKW